VIVFNAVNTIYLLAITICFDGSLAMWAILAVGLFNSIMFPTIFSLALDKLADATSHGAGVICLAIVGGAIVPLFQGILADNIGVQMSFILPAACYIFIVYYGLLGSKISVIK
jgi:FHS family L-fucose permease-like MFS transporter